MFQYKYPRPAVTVDAIILKQKSHELLLIQRKNDPFAGKWAFPGGFMEMDELLEKACQRELMEETGLFVEQLTFFCTCDAIDRDPRGRTLSCVYYSLVLDSSQVCGADDALCARWFSLDHLPELAFDHHLVIRKLIRKLSL